MANVDSVVGRQLADMFLDKWGTKVSIEGLKKQFSIKSSETSIFMSLFWLYYLAFIRSATSSPEKITTHQFQSIADNLTTNVLSRYKDSFKAKENPSDLLKLYGGIVQGLFSCYDEHLNSSPSVHWHIGKEMCLILNGHNCVPEPAMILYFCDMLHHDSLRIKQYIDSL